MQRRRRDPRDASVADEVEPLAQWRRRRRPAATAPSAPSAPSANRMSPERVPGAVAQLALASPSALALADAVHTPFSQFILKSDVALPVIRAVQAVSASRHSLKLPPLSTYWPSQ